MFRKSIDHSMFNHIEIDNQNLILWSSNHPDRKSWPKKEKKTYAQTQTDCVFVNHTHSGCLVNINRLLFQLNTQILTFNLKRFLILTFVQMMIVFARVLSLLVILWNPRIHKSYWGLCWRLSILYFSHAVI